MSLRTLQFIFVLYKTCNYLISFPPTIPTHRTFRSLSKIREPDNILTISIIALSTLEYLPHRSTHIKVVGRNYMAGVDRARTMLNHDDARPSDDCTSLAVNPKLNSPMTQGTILVDLWFFPPRMILRHKSAPNLDPY